MWYIFYCLAIPTDVCAHNFAGLVCFPHFSVMLGAIMQITHCLINIFVRHPRVSFILPILDGGDTGVLTPTYRLRRVFGRLSSKFILSHSQVFLGFLDLNLKCKDSLNLSIFLIGPNLVTIIGWGLRSGTIICQGQLFLVMHI